ncbi:nuclear pore complex protein Nup88-like [Dendronephthya gigantea]|uniref:nuclear pore complex protein Nup88-like n=1 Tax=Dendronephthya gigantea TaxID=151771 RepID=UPI00106C9FFE|nr:nuclear pore complex protein Nup88-like [Dendronephthya gigantea]
MAEAKALSLRNMSNNFPSNADKSRLSWESFLPNHAIFKTFENHAKFPEDETILDKNILAEIHGDLFLWDDRKKQINVANLKNLKAKNERSSKLQTFLCTSPPLFNVNKMVFSESGVYLALIGQHGICAVEVPQKRGKFTQYEHGKDKINCRSTNVDEHFYTCHQSITIFEAKWFPGSINDTHIVVLTSDNQMRVYDITKPRSPLVLISVGSVPANQSLCSPGKATFAEAFGEIVISFDFAGVVSSELFSKRTPVTRDSVVHPVFLLRENGDVLYMLMTLSGNRFLYELQGCLPMYPPAEDNYGVDSCSLICFPTNPVVVAITTSGGVIYHCIVLDSEEEDVFSRPFDVSDGVSSRDESVFSQSSTKQSLYVYECMELALSANSEKEKSFEDAEKFEREAVDNKDESYTVKLFKDNSSSNRYHCYHPAGVHTVTLPWLRNLQRFCNEADQVVSFDPNETGIVQHLICTNPVPSSFVNLIGFTVVSDWELGPTVVALTDAMECITKSLKFLNRPSSPAPHSSDGKEQNKQVESEERLSSGGEFENHIKQLLRRDSSNPLLRSSSKNTDLAPKDCYKFLTAASQTFRVEYLNRQKLAQKEIERRLDILRTQNTKQMEDLECLDDEKLALQERMEMLAERYEDTKDRQELILKRIESVLEFIQWRQPLLSHAEGEMKEELQRMERNIQTFKKSFHQLQQKRKYLGAKDEDGWTPKAKALSESHKRQLNQLLKEEGDEIQTLVKQVMNLKLQVGF